MKMIRILNIDYFLEIIHFLVINFQSMIMVYIVKYFEIKVISSIKKVTT
jgi:hypothetical protein